MQNRTFKNNERKFCKQKNAQVQINNRIQRKQNSMETERTLQKDRIDK